MLDKRLAVTLSLCSTMAGTAVAQYTATPVVPMQVPAPPQYTAPAVVPMQNSAPQQIQQMGQATQQLGQAISNAATTMAETPRTSAATEFKGDPLAHGEDFLRVCIRDKAAHPQGQPTIEAACNMYVWGVVSGINLYSVLSPNEILAAKKRGELGFSTYGTATAAAFTKSANSFDLVCVPDEVTVGQLRRVVETYILKHPTQSNWSTSKLTYDALIDAFPCQTPHQQ